MEKMPKPGAQSANVLRKAPAAIPAKIKNGQCPWCSGNLTYLFPFIQSGAIQPPKHCPLCGNPVRDDIEIEILQCSHCKTEIVDPKVEVFCRECGRHLNYESVGLESPKTVPI